MTAEQADEQGVKGCLCCDARGLCIEAKGVADPKQAGFITSIIRRAKSLAPSDADAPTVLIETDLHSIAVKEYDDMTIALYQAVGRSKLH